VNAVMRFIRSHATDVHGIAAGLGVSIEVATEQLVQLEAKKLIRMRQVCAHGVTPGRVWVPMATKPDSPARAFAVLTKAHEEV
jgi:hypothetical protein